jgi:hypothetical protein
MTVMQISRLRWLLAVTVVSSATILTGCKDPLTYENFTLIHENASSQAEVARIIGEPNNELDNQWLYERPEKHLTAIVDFDGRGLVVRKQWIDAMDEVWEDSGGKDAKEGSRQTTRIQTGRP